MDWKKIVTGIVIGAVLGIGGTLLSTQGRIDKLEAQHEILQRQVEQPREATLKTEVSEARQKPSWPCSPDGKYKAVRDASGTGVHYQVKEIKTGLIALTTHAQYETANDVKAGLFSPDSKEIAAAYHYGHEGRYTWVGIWDIEAGNLVNTKRTDDWTTDIYWVFDKDRR